MQNKQNLVTNDTLVEITTTVKRSFGQTFLPFVIWQITIQKSFSPLHEYQSYLKQHREILVVHFIEMENNFKEEVLRVQKEVNKQLVENDIEPIISLEEYNLQVDSTTKDSAFALGFHFVRYLLLVLMRYFIKKTLKDLFNTQFGIRLLGLIFLTFLVEGVIKKRYQFLPFERCVPAFSVPAQRLSLETFCYVTRKEPNLRSSSDQPFQDFRKPILLERINQLQRGNQTNWSLPMESVTLLPDSLVVEINQLWTAANKQMYQGMFQDRTAQPPRKLQLDNPQVTPTILRWYHLSPRRYMGVLPSPAENNHNLSVVEDKKSQFSEGEGLTGWLKRFYLEMDEFPLYLSPQYNIIKRFHQSGVFRLDELCSPPSTPPETSLDALTNKASRRWKKRWIRQYAPDLTNFDDRDRRWRQWFKQKRMLGDRWVRAKKHQLAEEKIKLGLSEPEPAFLIQSTKIKRLSDILSKTKGVASPQTPENQTSQKVFLPRPVRDPEYWKLEVRVQDPLPKWVPKWLHWLKYFGARRSRTPVSMDDLIPEKVYERYSGEYGDYWNLDAETVKELFLTNKRFTASTDQTPTDDTRTEIRLSRIRAIISQIREKQRLEEVTARGRQRFLNNQRFLWDLQRKQISTVNFEKGWSQCWTVEELTRLKTSLKEMMYQRVLNSFFQNFENNNVLELKQFNQKLIREFDPKEEDRKAEERQKEKIKEKKRKEKERKEEESKNQKKKEKDETEEKETDETKKDKEKDVVIVWLEGLKLFSDKALFESKSKCIEKFAWIDHKVDQLVDPAIEALELLQSLKPRSSVFGSFPTRLLPNQLPSRRMSGYASPDMDTAELKAVYLKSLYRRLPKTLHGLKWKKKGYRNQPSGNLTMPFESTFKIDFPSTFLSWTHWFEPKDLNSLNSFIDNSPSVKKTFISKYRESDVNRLKAKVSLHPVEANVYQEKELFDVDTETLLDKLSTTRWFEKLSISQTIKEEKEKKKQANQEKGHVSFSAPVNSYYEIEQNNKEEVEKWLQRHFNTDNPASDLKQALLEFELRRHIYKNRFTKNEKREGKRSLTPTSLPRTSQSINLAHEKPIVQTTTGKRIGNWLVPKAWKLRPWLPTLDTDPNDVVVWLPPEVWKRYLIAKKPFIDAVFEGLIHQLEIRLDPTVTGTRKKPRTEQQNEQLGEYFHTYFNLLTMGRLKLKKISRNELLKFFLPKVYYRRLEEKSNEEGKSNSCAPMLDYASPLKRFRAPRQRHWYRTTNRFVKKEGEKYLPLPLLGDAPQAPQTPIEKVTFWPYSEGVWQQGSIGLDVVGGIYDPKSTLLYSDSKPALWIQKGVDKLMSPTTRTSIKLLLPSALHRRGSRPEVWEPLTPHSWLIVYKLGYMWLCWKMMSYFYDRYVRHSLSEFFKLLLSLGEFNEEILYELGFEDLPINSRTFTKLKTRFSDIAAIDDLIPILGEIVWFLRNRGRGSKTVNKGVLLVGPPGTGKTFLVQAIGGESKVPVLAQSGSTFYNLNDPDKVAVAMIKLFNKAQQIAPCLLFVDEVDSLGSTRGKISGDEEDIMTRRLRIFPDVFRGYADREDNVLYRMNNILLPEMDLHRFGANREAELRDYLEMLDAGITGQLAVYGGPVESNATRNDAILARSLNREHDRVELKSKNVNLLLTFLTQLDGVKPRRGVLVIGATNRADTLDPAFMRPGRFDQIIHLALPGQNKRIEIFKFYSRKLGVDKLVSKRYWEYLANRTAGWSIADLAVAINQSAMLAIIKDTTHTIETIESGIEMVINSGETPPKQNKDPFFASRRAFYQAARAIVHYLLPEHPPAVVLHLFPQPTNTRENRRTNPAHRNEKVKKLPRKALENLLVGFYAGKAGELIHLIETSSTTKNELSQRLTEAVVYRNKKVQKIKNRNLSFFSGNIVSCVGEKLLSTTLLGLVQARGLVPKDFLPFLSTIESSRNLVDFVSFYHEQLPSFVSLMNFQPVKGSKHHSNRDTLLQTVFLRYSELGYEDFKTASGLAVAMIEKWHLYSNVLAVHKRNAVIPDLNRQERKKTAYILPYLEEMSSELEDDFSVPPNLWHPLKRYQIWQPSAYHFESAIFKLDYRKKVRDWYRIYLADRTQTRWNVEWVPPDAYYHDKETLKGVTAYGVTSSDEQMQCTLNRWYGIKRDYLYRGLILSAFYKALLIVHNNRELLDLFAHHLLWRGILRQPEIETVMQAFGHHQPKNWYIFD